MRTTAVVLTLLLAAADAPLEVHAEWEGPTLRVALHLDTPLPEPLHRALPSGAVVRVLYPVVVKADRRFWLDRKLWKGEAESSVVFDPVIGRYRCRFRLNEVVLASRETPSPDEARAWLTDPPPFNLAVHPGKRRVRLRARAVFSTSTTWLVFPMVDGTPWVTVDLGGGR